MTKQPLSLSTVLGTGAFCAALVAAPLATGLLSGSAYALASEMTKNCTSEVLAKLGTTQDKLGSIKVSENDLTDAINSAKKLPDYNKYAAVFDEYMDALLDSDTAASTATQKAVATKLTSAMSTAGFTLVNETSAIEDFDAANDTEHYGLLNTVYNLWQQAHPEWSNYYDIYTAINYEKASANGGPTYSKEDAFLGVVCSATKTDSSFEVAYTTGNNPFANLGGSTNTPSTGDNTGNIGNTGNNKPNTPPTQQPTTIENDNKNVKVSGININVNYTLNVNLVAADLLKLSGNDFKNSTNQAFYDIYLYDSQDNRIENTGNVSVSIKLPSNMSVNSDFVVYYVPTAANGEYLTDQAQAIKGVKVSSDGWLTFQTDHFSVYGIVEYPKNKAPNTGVVAQSDGSATTTGAKVVAGVIATLTATGAGIVAHRQVLRCKKSKNQQ